MYKFKENIFKLFNNLYAPGVLILLMSFFIGRDEVGIKIFLVLCIPLLTLRVIIKKINEIEMKNEEKIKLIFLILIFEVLFVAGAIFKGVPIMPFFVAPFNNLYFYGVIFSLILIGLSKSNGEINKKKWFIYFLGVWGLIFSYQFFIY